MLLLAHEELLSITDLRGVVNGEALHLAAKVVSILGGRL